VGGRGWGAGWFRVHSPKTEQHAGKVERWLPFFPELLPQLEEAFDLAPRARRTSSTATAIPMSTCERNGSAASAALASRLGARLFLNLRVSRETELASEYPMHVVSA